MSGKSGRIIYDFTTGSIPKQMAVFSFPLFLSNALQIVYNMVDMIIVGQVVGKTGMSGVTIGGDLLSLLTFLVMGFSGAGQIIIAQYVGAGKSREVGKVIGNLASVLCLGGIVLGSICFLFRAQLLTLMSTPDEAWDQAYAYFTVCIFGVLFTYGYNTVSAILRGLGDSRHPFVFIAIAAVLNIVLDVVFVMGLAMAAFGAALATIISQAVSFFISLIFLYHRRNDLGFKIRKEDFKFSGDVLPVLLKLGFPMAIKGAAVMISKLFVNSWVNSYGVVISSASGLESKYNSVMNLFSNAINTATGSMVGQNIGAKKYKRVSRVVFTAAIMSLSIMTIVVIFVVLFPRTIFGFFTSDEEVIEACMSMIFVLVLLSYACGLRAPANGFVNGTGNSKLNFVMAIFDAIINRIGFSLLFGLVLDMGWVGFLLGDAVSGYTPFVIGSIYFLTGKWKTRTHIIKE